MIIVLRKRLYGVTKILHILKEGINLGNCSFSLFLRLLNLHAVARFFSTKFYDDLSKATNDQKIYKANNQFLYQFDGFAN